MSKFSLISVLFSIVLAVLSTSANAALMGRLETSPGSGVFQAYFDDILNITWTTNANINGIDSWSNQLAWAAGLNIDGVTGWRLPSMDVNGDNSIVNCVSASQADCMDNEYGHLFNYGEDTTKGNGIVPGISIAPFTDVQSDIYWSGTAPDAFNTWTYRFDSGSNLLVNSEESSNPRFAWAVHEGDVGAVPVPAAVWLFGSGLLALVGIARRKKAA